MTDDPPRRYFSTHEVLVIAALAAMGGATGVVLSHVGAGLRGLIGVPGGLQFLAGAHVLWCVLAGLLVRRPGAPAATGVLKGAVEMLSGSGHGAVVLVVSAVAGAVAEAVLLAARGRARPAGAVIAGALAAASNVPVFQLFASLPAHRVVVSALLGISAVAAASGAVLGGWLALLLLAALRKAGLAPAADSPARPRRFWALVAIGVTLAAVAAAAVWVLAAGRRS